jgi:hypothetical protein
LKKEKRKREKERSGKTWNIKRRRKMLFVSLLWWELKAAAQLKLKSASYALDKK